MVMWLDRSPARFRIDFSNTKTSSTVPMELDSSRIELCFGEGFGAQTGQRAGLLGKPAAWLNVLPHCF